MGKCMNQVRRCSTVLRFYHQCFYHTTGVGNYVCRFTIAGNFGEKQKYLLYIKQTLRSRITVL